MVELSVNEMQADEIREWIDETVDRILIGKGKGNVIERP